MGYAYYDTPLGPAGYSVEDVCHKDGCDTEINRGLGYLCGSIPGRDCEYGCGHWFCSRHLVGGPEEADHVSNLCEECSDRLEVGDQAPAGESS